MKTSPFPWEKRVPRTPRHKESRWVVDRNGRYVAKVYGSNPKGTSLPDETEANATLIEAAPDLLYAALLVLGAHDEDYMAEIADAITGCDCTNPDHAHTATAYRAETLEALRAAVDKARR